MTMTSQTTFHEEPRIGDSLEEEMVVEEDMVE
jgi:hypothetical protein